MYNGEGRWQEVPSSASLHPRHTCCVFTVSAWLETVELNTEGFLYQPCVLCLCLCVCFSLDLNLNYLQRKNSVNIFSLTRLFTSVWPQVTAFPSNPRWCECCCCWWWCSCCWWWWWWWCCCWCCSSNECKHRVSLIYEVAWRIFSCPSE